MAKWFTQEKEEKDEDAGKSVEAKFGSIDTAIAEQKKVLETQGTVLESVAASIKAMNDRQKNEDDARVKAEKDRKAAETRAASESETPEDRFNRLAENPNEYIDSRTSGTARLALITSAKLLRTEVLSEKEYYTGEFKSQVDSLIDNHQNLQDRNNPNFILNCYKVVLADNMDKITKGELRKNAALHSFSDGGNSGGRSTDPNVKPTVEYRDQQGATANKAKYAASQMGLTDEDLVEAAKSGAIHGLEVVA